MHFFKQEICRFLKNDFDAQWELGPFFTFCFVSQNCSKLSRFLSFLHILKQIAGFNFIRY